MADDTHGATSGLPFRTAVHVWIRVALNSFGGPAGQIAVMPRVRRLVPVLGLSPLAGVLFHA